MLNKYTSVQKHYFLLSMLLVGIFVFQLWISFTKQNAQFDNGYDFLNFATLGRQLVEHHSLPTFLYPGKTFDGPVKPFGTFFPCIFIGYHDFVPAVMVALYATMICLCCYIIASICIPRSIGLMVMILSAALNPYIATYAFKYAFAFDLMILLDFVLAIMTIIWVRSYHIDLRQPGLLYCIVMGAVAGIAWYAHPTCISALLAVGCFLLVSLGKNIFTWRALIVGGSAIAASLPFWLYCLAHSNVAGSWHGYSAKYYREISLWRFLFSKEGYLYFIFSPSEDVVMRVFLAIVFLMSVFLVVSWVARVLGCMNRVKLSDAVKGGVKLPLAAYIVFAVLSMVCVTFSTSGMTKAAYGWLYGIELWFWLIIASGYLWKYLFLRSRVIAVVLLSVLVIWFGFLTSKAVARLDSGAAERKWLSVAEDAQSLCNAGITTILSDQKEPYSLFAIGPSGMTVASAFNPWVRDMAKAVEEHSMPGVIASLNSANLGPEAWQTHTLDRYSVLHAFHEPDAGVMISNHTWSAISSEPDSGLDLLKDDDVSTSWISKEVLPELELRFEQQVSICRIVLMFNRERPDWVDYTFPRDILVEGKLESGEWVVLSDGARDDGYFWDGGRIFFAHRERNRFDIRFNARRVSAVKLSDRDSADKRPRIITELYLYAKSNMNHGNPELKDLLAYLKKSECNTVLADRYISAQVAKAMPEIKVWRPIFLRNLSDLGPPSSWPWFAAYESIPARDAAIVSDSSNEARIRKLLKEDGYVFSIYSSGRYVVFSLKGREKEFSSDLIWNGLSVSHYFNKLASDYQENHKNNVPEEAFSKPAVYGDVAELVGVYLSDHVVSAGETVEIAYYWSVPHRWPYVYYRPMVFSHIVNGDCMLNDDHRLLTEYEHKYLYQVLDNEIFVERRSVKIPVDAAKGKYRFEVGLHFRGERVKVRSKAKEISVRKKAAWFDAFEVR